MKNLPVVSALTIGALLAASAWVVPGSQDRVYIADQNSNTVS